MERTYDYYKVEYEFKERSPNDIAEEWNTYPNKIRREIKRWGFKLRDKSEAQKAALKSGRVEHPTKGKKRSEDVKARISSGIARAWKGLSKAEREHRAAVGRQIWDTIPEADKVLMRKAALEAVREASVEGSKLERFLMESLRNEGYSVEFHRDGLIPNQRLQLDLYIPSLNVAIEIDGPSHFFPIWGEKNLQRNISADNKKNSLLLSHGYVVIRVKCISQTTSESHKHQLLAKTVEILKSVKQKFPSLEHRLIEIELT
jgi:very-short-patch-repair endonuclease